MNGFKQSSTNSIYMISQLQGKRLFRKIIRRVALFLAPFLLVFFSGCAERITLTIDFRDAVSWRYLLGVDVKGSLEEADTAKHFISSLRTYLQGNLSAHDENTVLFRIMEPRITTDLLSYQEQRNIEGQFENAVLYFAPKEGSMYLPDTMNVPMVNIGGWDLFRNLVKVIPVLPESPVKVGDTWERERQLPVKTIDGSALGHLYQMFTFDSLFSLDKQIECAAISWSFSYRIEPGKSESLDKLNNMPLSGTGTGTAVIDLGKKRIVTAHVTFETSALNGTDSQIGWIETLHMEFIE